MVIIAISKKLTLIYCLLKNIFILYYLILEPKFSPYLFWTFLLSYTADNLSECLWRKDQFYSTVWCNICWSIHPVLLCNKWIMQEHLQGENIAIYIQCHYLFHFFRLSFKLFLLVKMKCYIESLSEDSFYVQCNIFMHKNEMHKKVKYLSAFHVLTKTDFILLNIKAAFQKWMFRHRNITACDYMYQESVTARSSDRRQTKWSRCYGLHRRWVI